MNLVMTLYVALLFFVLCPGILVSLPPKGSRLIVALTHAAVFALVFHLTYKMVLRLSITMERFMDAPPKPAEEKKQQPMNE
jgi:hypothetical protein